MHDADPETATVSGQGRLLSAHVIGQTRTYPSAPAAYRCHCAGMGPIRSIARSRSMGLAMHVGRRREIVQCADAANTLDSGRALPFGGASPAPRAESTGQC